MTQIDEKAYQHALQMNRGKTFSMENADECFRYFISCYEAAKPKGEWQPIETAPRDGTEILLSVKLRWGKMALDKKQSRVGTGSLVGAYWWNTEKGYWQNRIANFTSQPTHWMPLTSQEEL